MNFLKSVGMKRRSFFIQQGYHNDPSMPLISVLRGKGWQFFPKIIKSKVDCNSQFEVIYDKDNRRAYELNSNTPAAATKFVLAQKVCQVHIINNLTGEIDIEYQRVINLSGEEEVKCWPIISDPKLNPVMKDIISRGMSGENSFDKSHVSNKHVRNDKQKITVKKRVLLSNPSLPTSKYKFLKQDPESESEES